MSYVTPAVRAAQEAYAARPFAVRWCDSHFSNMSRFDTLDEAFEYIRCQWVRVRKQVERNPHHASNLRRSYLETPEGRVSLRYVLLCDDVNSY
jgi:hypothetical protein